MQFANIIIDRKVKELDRYLQYKILPKLEGEIKVGSMVEVPLGRGNTLTHGYVMEISDTPDYDVEKMKYISRLVPNRLSVDSEMLVIAHWMKERYGVTMSKALQTVTPVKTQVRQKERFYYTIGCEREIFLQALYEARRKKNMQARARFLETLKEEEILEHSIAVEKLKISPASIQAMVERGLVNKQKITDYREGFRSDFSIKDKEAVFMTLPELNEQQKQVVEEIWQEYEGGAKRPCLLHGITGSGKTEVYMELIARVVSQKKQAILLIPEIALTYPMVMRFYKRFRERVTVLNSRMSQGERYDQYLRAKNGEVDVVIGPRSALFTPFASLGIIIMDEEHEDSYKNENNPKYDAHDVAIYRAKLHDAIVIFGSATPSIETNYLAENGYYRKLRLTIRGVTDSHLATTHIVDMRLEMQQGNSSIISKKLREEMQKRLDCGEQIMLFLNRRGYSNYLACYRCGEVVKCPRCDISLTYHQDNRLRCHYCGYQIHAVNQCTKCGVVGKLQPMGIGTQKAMALVAQEFKQARILRMDQDTTAQKNAHQEILEAFANHEADILLGTQMIVKGHDYANVTLVGILLADRSLNMPTYRASEKTFQLLTQAAGRAGRGKKAGDVVIQTYRPEHFAIQMAAAQNYDSFYEKEIQYRRLLNYPPTLKLMLILFQCEDEEKALHAAHHAIRVMSEDERTRQLMVYGPTEDAVPKINYVFRKNVIVKSETVQALELARSLILERVSDLVTESVPSKFTQGASTAKYFTNERKDVIIEFDIVR